MWFCRHKGYCGKIPKDLFEDILIPLFEKFGTIWDLRLMMDPVSGRNRGYCFVTFTEKSAAQQTVSKVIDINQFLAGKLLYTEATMMATR